MTIRTHKRLRRADGVALTQEKQEGIFVHSPMLVDFRTSLIELVNLGSEVRGQGDTIRASSRLGSACM